MSSESMSSKNQKLEKLLRDSEARNNLQGFIEILLDIAKENPEILNEQSDMLRQKNEHLY